MRLLPEKLVIAENDATPPLRICLASKPAASDIISRKIGGADWEVGVSSSCGEILTIEPSITSAAVNVKTQARTRSGMCRGYLPAWR